MSISLYIYIYFYMHSKEIVDKNLMEIVVKEIKNAKTYSNRIFYGIIDLMNIIIEKKEVEAIRLRTQSFWEDNYMLNNRFCTDTRIIPLS